MLASQMKNVIVVASRLDIMFFWLLPSSSDTPERNKGLWCGMFSSLRMSSVCLCSTVSFLSLLFAIIMRT
jgi:hypothetical protein